MFGHHGRMVIIADHWLQEHATDFSRDMREAPVDRWLRERDVRLLASGIQHRVYRIEGEPWVVKEARWDLELELFEAFTLPLHAGLTEGILKQFSFSFLPSPEHVKVQRDLYGRASRYLGSHADTPALRARLKDALPLMHGTRPADLNALAKMLTPDALAHDFLPREHLLFGPSYAEQNKGKPTFYLFQEFTEGRTLHDTDIASLPDAQRDQLAVFLMLTVLLYEEEGIVPDTRPRYILSEANDWFAKTDNIIVGTKGLTFIDTGWFWERHAPIVRRGFVLPERTVAHAKDLLASLSHAHTG
jgi:hypothetical protein